MYSLIKGLKEAYGRKVPAAARRRTGKGRGREKRERGRRCKRKADRAEETQFGYKSKDNWL